MRFRTPLPYGKEIIMKDILIIVLLLAVLVIGIVWTVKHFQGKSGCCGGGGYRVKKKKLAHVLYQKTFLVEGMHCVNCKNRVEEVVGDIKGVAGKVDLKAGTLTVSYAEQVDDALIISKLERAGYPVKGEVA